MSASNAEEVIGETGYDPDSDIENTADSVFCAHGAGFIVPWYQVEEHMHVESRADRIPLAAGERLRSGGSLPKLPLSGLLPGRSSSRRKNWMRSMCARRIRSEEKGQIARR